MAERELHKNRRWEVILVVITCVLGLFSSFIHDYLSPKESTAAVPSVIVSPVFNNNVSTNANRSFKVQTIKNKQKQIVNNGPEQVVNKVSENVNKYVDIYLNVNSGDVILVNGKPVSADEISEIPNTLKLISGRKYTIKINNCPEKEITAIKDMTISVCM